jgi:mannose-1-phosphate guanylyltransferase
VTLGVPPTHPSTGYGYIERGKPFPGKVRGAFEVARFAEKPDLPTAKRFLRSGRFDWNSGLFLFSVATFADRLTKFLPEVDREIRRAFQGDRAGFPKRLTGAYRRMPSISVDYGILEKEAGILVLRANVGWSDLGTWRSLHEFLAETGENVAFGDVILSDCRNVLVRTDRGVAAVLGMDDVVVVRSGDAVLVCPRARSEEVKGVLEEVRRRFPALA